MPRSAQTFKFWQRPPFSVYLPGIPLVLEGTNFGVDFNPAADRLRIVSDSGQNLRINPDTGVAATDKDLGYAPNDPNEKKTPGVAAAAYTNNDNDPTTGTDLYDIDATRGALALQAPPNDGILKTIAADDAWISDLLAFDIGSDNMGLAAFQPSGSTTSRLASVDVFAGTASELGEIGGGEAISGLAIVIDAASYEEVYALNEAQELIGFRARNPNTVRIRVMISGLQTGEYLLGIDFRPATGRLYGLGSSSQIYVINHMTGAAAPVGLPIDPPLSLDNTVYGVDFNPAADRLRVTSSAGLNLRINVDTGVVAPDQQLIFDVNDPNKNRTPKIVGSAYLNNDNDPTTGTTLYNIDADSNVLTIQDPPNDGVQKTVGSLRLDVALLVGFDIRSSDNRALAAFRREGSTVTRLYVIDLSNGRIRVRGNIDGGNALITGLAISLEQDR
ncbi:DUF4394 domain-containing protein [Candidatus Gracilibacteria bacterium]|nr:DUF4394 domain-containing protein [Candidatus Gracilibacteria bacterium]